MRRAWLILGLLFALVTPASADIFGLPPPFLVPIIAATPPAAPVTWTLVAHTTIPSAAVSSTSANIDTSTATVIIATVGYYKPAGPTPTLTDSKGNTYTAVTLTSGPVETATQMFICLNPTVGTGHNFSVTGGGGNFYFSGSVAAFKGSATPSFNSGAGQNGNSAAATSSTTGSVTPATNNNLIVSGMTYNLVGGAASINGAFAGNITDQQPNGPGEASALAWTSQAGTGTANPTWTATGTSATPDVSAHIVVIAP